MNNGELTRLVMCFAAQVLNLTHTTHNQGKVHAAARRAAELGPGSEEVGTEPCLTNRV